MAFAADLQRHLVQMPLVASAPSSSPGTHWGAGPAAYVVWLGASTKS
jgi:hypothetical protein